MENWLPFRDHPNTLAHQDTRRRAIFKPREQVLPAPEWVIHGQAARREGRRESFVGRPRTGEMLPRGEERKPGSFWRMLPWAYRPTREG